MTESDILAFLGQHGADLAMWLAIIIDLKSLGDLRCMEMIAILWSDGVGLLRAGANDQRRLPAKHPAAVPVARSGTTIFEVIRRGWRDVASTQQGDLI